MIKHRARSALAVRVPGDMRRAVACATAAGAARDDFECAPDDATHSTLVVACTPGGVVVLRRLLSSGTALPAGNMARRVTAMHPHVGNRR